MATTKKLMTLEVHTDSDTGLHEIGEFDWRIVSDSETVFWIDRDRAGFAKTLRFLADAVENSQAPFQLSAHQCPKCGHKRVSPGLCILCRPLRTYDDPKEASDGSEEA